MLVPAVFMTWAGSGTWESSREEKEGNLMQMPQAKGETDLATGSPKKGSQIACCRIASVMVNSDGNSSRKRAIAVWRKGQEFWSHEDLA